MKVNSVHIFGYGSAGKRHERLLHELRPELKVTHSDVHEPASRPICDAYIIASPPETHEYYIEKYECSHLLCEGPITILPDTHGYVHQVASNWRFVRPLVELKEMYPYPPAIAHFWFDYDLRKWRPDIDIRSTCYYNSGIDYINVHEIDMALWFCGPIDHLAKAESSVNISAKNDACTYLLRHLTGCLTTINSSWIGSDYTRGMRLVFPNGDSITQEWRSPEHDTIVNDSYTEQLRHWLYCIEHNQTPRVTFQDGYNAYRVAIGDIS